MKTKNIISFLLLFTLCFSVVHEFAFAKLDNQQCNVIEFLSAVEASDSVSTLHNVHIEYHETYTYTSQNNFVQSINKIIEIKLDKENYKFLVNLNLIKPPIA